MEAAVHIADSFICDNFVNKSLGLNAHSTKYFVEKWMSVKKSKPQKLLRVFLLYAYDKKKSTTTLV